MPVSRGINAVACGLVIAAIVTITVGWAVYTLGKQSGEYEANSDSYAHHAEQKIRRSCSNLDGIAQAECIRNVVETANEHERSESDLVAQHRMALWALLMLVVTAAMAVITGVGVYYVWRTLIATQKMAFDTRRIGEAQVRAYIGVEITDSVVESGKPIAFGIKVTNHGASPATNIATYSSVVVRSRGWKWPESNNVEEEGLSSGHLHPGGSIFLRADPDTPKPFPLNPPFEKDLRDDKLCVFGRVTIYFDDVFRTIGGQRRMVQFSFEFSGKNCFSSKSPRISKDAKYGT